MSTEAERSTLTDKADAAFRQAMVKVIARARQTGTPVILWENGQVTERSGEELMKRLGPAQKNDDGQGGQAKGVPGS